MNVSEKTVTEAAREVVEQDRGVLFAYLFGSTVGGRARADSDVDFAVYMRGSLDKQEAFSRAMQMAGALQEQIDRTVHPVLLNQAPAFLRLEVLRNGVLAFCRDADARHEFQVRTVREYGDMKPKFDRVRELMIAKIERGELVGPPRDLAASVAKARRVSQAIARLQGERQSSGSR